ncbi:MAG: mannosyltransferase family protein [Patescibacteria group bacterium]
MKKKDHLYIYGLFFGWRILLFMAAFLAGIIIPVFGSRFPYWDRVLTITNLPNWIWGFGNFDGVHYLKIAQNGYSSNLSQAFFPLYPYLIKFFNIFPKNKDLDLQMFVDPSYFYTAMILSAVFFILALYFLVKLWRENYNSKTALLSILLLCSFPTAFYFGAVYSESLLLLLIVLTFWFAKKGKFFWAGVTAALASITKIQGVLLFVFLAIELFIRYRKEKLRFSKKMLLDFIGVLLSPFGLISYMFYLQKSTGDPLFFLSAQPGFGAERSALPIILMPQVIYRYLKIFFSVNFFSLSFFNAFLEFSMTIAVIAILIITFKKMRFSYWIFSVLVVILPTLTGTLSSMPRYVLMAFMVIPFLAERFNKSVRYIIIVQSLLQAILLGLFIRGYWIS